MIRMVLPFASRINTGFDRMTRQEKAYWMSDFFGLVYSAPLALIGILWLLSKTKIMLVQEHWLIILIVTGLIFLFRQLDFFTFTEIKTGLYADWGSTFDSIAIWSGVLIIGPTAFWPGIILTLSGFFLRIKKYISTEMLLSRTRQLAMEIADQSLVGMLAVTGIELPLNRQTLETSPEGVSDWIVSRERWERFNLVRNVLTVAGWSFLCLAALSERQD